MMVVINVIADASAAPAYSVNKFLKKEACKY